MLAIRDFYVADTAVVTGNVALGPEVSVWFGAVLRGDLALISVGKRVNFQDGAVVHTDYDAPMTIEDGVVVGHGAILHGKHIGKDTLIGMGAILLSGSEIGEECIIGAGALVGEGKRIPPRSLVVGLPGKILRSVTAEEVERTRTNCGHYLEMARRYVRGEQPAPWLRLGNP
jgi:carbonic anhydrase/acetyltransferase-like protein (isoleucine patch superfamily)